MTYPEKQRCVANFLKEGHTVNEATQHFQCSIDEVKKYIVDEVDKETLIKGIRLGEYRQSLKQGLMFAGYMATIHTVSETAKNFHVSIDCVRARLKLLKESGKFETKLKMAEAGSNVAEKRR